MKITWYQNLKIGNKLLIWFLTVSLVPMIIVSVITFVSLYQSSVDDEIEKKIIILDIIADTTYTVLHDNELIAIGAANDSEIIAALENQDGYASLQMNYVLTRALYKNGVLLKAGTAAIFDVRRELIYVSPRESMHEALAEQADAMMDSIISSTVGIWGNPIRFNGEFSIFPYYRRVKNYVSNTVPGAVMIGVNTDELRRGYRRYEKDGEYIVIVDADEKVVSASQPSWVGEDFGNLFQFQGGKRKEGYLKCILERTGCLAAYHVDDRLALTYYYITPESIMLRTPNRIISITAIIVAIAISGIALASRLLSASVAKPIVKLAETMDRANTTDVRHSETLKGEIRNFAELRYDGDQLRGDEIGRLSVSFTEMMERLEKSSIHIREVEDQRRLAQYNALKWQINPHFLYNTLSTIVWLAKSGYIDEMIELTRSLSTLLRIGISKDSDLITIRDEIEHVKSFLDIEITRYQGKFKYILDIEPEVLSLYTVKIVLQPLVENAIHHGLSERSGQGLVKIAGELDNGCVVLKVMDNGDKMTQQEIDALNEYIRRGDPESRSYGIGVKNVHDRITYYYQGDYGLEYSRAGGFTIVKITLPVVRQGNGNV